MKLEEIKKFLCSFIQYFLAMTGFSPMFYKENIVKIFISTILVFC